MELHLCAQLFNDDALLKSFRPFIHTDRLSIDCLIKLPQSIWVRILVHGDTYTYIYMYQLLHLQLRSHKMAGIRIICLENV